jgi:hypothetical protein
MHGAMSQLRYTPLLIRHRGRVALFPFDQLQGVECRQPDIWDHRVASPARASYDLEQRV